ncbi:endo-1,4-beta-xylanase [Paludibacter sp.]|uniref:endo-1,4-beta-xylanase n=1 Tax=Paludibacter sp. TaxID=1898105 RepID=UPI0013562620|nr:endo-1,4-beta-xylanase [Paludibacter sp.]MTK54499.1 endo-1,4-beta-xylanase [Paludibacter sp.]
MKCKFKLVLAVFSVFLLASCADNAKLDFFTQEPDSLAQLEYLNSYKVLKSYVDTITNPNFKLGAGVSLSDFSAKNAAYRLVQSNFKEVTAGYEMKHGAVVQNDGTLAVDNVTAFLKNAKSSGLSVFGHTLCWHSNQNATYLKSVIAPTVVTGSAPPRYDVLWSQDFETDNNSTSGSVYSWNSNAVKSFTAAGGGKGGVGRALTITNATVRTNDWDCQIFFTFPKAVHTGDKLRFTMDIKSDVNASYPTQAHTAPGAYKFWNFFGTLSSTPTWNTYVNEMTVTSDQDGCNTIAFNLGKTATTFYFDNAKVEIWNPNPGSYTVEKTSDEKKALIDKALDSWISGMLGATKNYVNAWDVVNEPMSDWPDPTQLKTGVGKTLAADEFYWQDYLGKDYAVRAFELARKYGNPTDKLFINDYGLEGDDQAKCKGLIAYIQYIESKGQKVDGIGTQMHVTLGQTTMTGIRAMLTNLAATGKLIKISELDMGIRPTGSTANLKTANVTLAQMKQMADFYKQIVKAYFEIIPVAQRYGITQWSTTDSPTSSSWRPGEPIGLWDANFSRKPAYGGFADGLQK